MMAGKPERREAESPTPVRTVEGRVAAMGEAEARPDPLVPLSTRVPESLRKRIRMAALDHDRDVQDVVAESIETWLARHERARG